ncbi:type II restriction endonuclease subunit R [Bacteroidetes/Chlorobi group bacterium MS-B_bin-24]|jgi:hypothetical protein|nr:MAG: type II restriction endonuclease subunit R [Bacteroidetes/Chlorobi group bacterium MS-B_bin-24]
MINCLRSIFDDANLVKKIQKKLPYLFQLAEMENSRAGKTGMEVGSTREKIIIALLIYKFGFENVEVNIPIMEPEIDVRLFGEPISIKTISGVSPNGVKLIWTVDSLKAKEFQEKYYPKSDILLIHINWGGIGGFYWVPLATQKRVFDKIGKSEYIKLPKPGTNPRGVEISKTALLNLIEDYETKKIEIKWIKEEIEFNPFKRWIDFWREE